MSLPWNKTVQLRIGVQAVHGCLHPAWSPRRTLANCLHYTTPESSTDLTSQTLAPSAPFDAAMAATLSELGAVRSSRVKDALILLANAKVHFDVVPGDYVELSERQLQAIAQACLSELLGDRALGSTVRWDLQRDARHLVIAAIESRDIDLLEQLAREHGIERLSVQPEFCWHWNQHASALRQDIAVFATVNENHMVAALVVSGAITAFTCGPVQPPSLDPSDSTSRKNGIDDRVDRLLASVGQDPLQVQSCLLVAPDGYDNGLHARWQMIDSKAELV